MSLLVPKERSLCVAVFLACLAMNLWFSSVGLHNNLMEGHEFRQTQTALTARYFQTGGWQLAYPLPLFGPPWSAPLEFPLYQYCAAKLSTLAAMPLKPAGRLVSLAFFYLSLPAFFLLLGHLPLPPHRRWLFLALLLVSPAYLYYSRSFMIESVALCAAAWFLHGYGRSLVTRRARWIVWTAAVGVIAALTKITTFATFLVPAVWFTVPQLWRARRALAGTWSAVLSVAGAGLAATIPGVLAGVAWIHFGDTVKAGNPLSHFLMSAELHDWTYGSLAQRLSPSFWSTILATSSSSTLHPGNLLLFATFALFIGRAARGVSWGLLACFLAGPLVLANLYLLHDYYFYATGVFLLAGMTLAWSELLDLPSVSLPGKWMVIVLCLGAQIHGFTHSYFLLQDPRRPEPPVLARVLSAVADPDDVILIYGLEWNPVLPYYAGRRAIMVSSQYAGDRTALDTVIRRLPEGRIGAIVATGTASRNSDFLRSLARSLAINDRPVLSSDDAQLYLAERLIPPSVRILENINLGSFTLAVPAESPIPGVTRVRYFVAKLPNRTAFDMMSPLPEEVVAPFGIAVSMVDGRRVFNAHAPTEIVFSVPAGASTIRMDYGLLPEAYENGHSLNGVRFLVELIRPTGERTVLFDSFLNPTSQPADRGLHHAEVSLPAGAQGRLIFSTHPGTANNISFNWAYWTDLSIK